MPSPPLNSRLDSDPPSGNVKTSADIDHVRDALGPNLSETAAGRSKPDEWKSTAYPTAKLFLCTAKEPMDSSDPLKDVVAGLCFILENCEVRRPSHTRYLQYSRASQQNKVDKQVVESLAPRVKALSTSLCTPVSEDDDKEETRRKELGR